MDKEEKLQCATRYLHDVKDLLHEAATTFPALDRPRHVFMRMAKAAARPVRIGILGEANSGKSSLVNLLAGVPVLPASPITNARFPVLLTYASEPYVVVIYAGGEKVTFPLLENVTQTLTFVQNNAGNSNLPVGKRISGDNLKLLEVGLPSNKLRSTEILCLPAGHLGGPSYGIDVSIWTTAATQAWCESERTQWAKLPRSVRRRGLLAVTFSDLADGKKNDQKRLQTVLEASAKPYFQGICFVANDDSDSDAAAAENKAVFAKIQHLVLQYAAKRVTKAMAVAHRVMAKSSAKTGLSPQFVRNGFGIHAVATTSNDLCESDRLANLRQPFPRRRPVDTKILRYRHRTRIAARNIAQKAVQASQPPVAEKRSKESHHWTIIGTAAAVVCIVSLTIIQLGLIGANKNPVANHPLSVSDVAQRSSTERTETRRNTETEAAAVRERGKAQAEAALAEERKLAMAEAAVVEARRLAEAKAAAAEERRLAEVEAAAAEARRLAEAKAAAAEERRLAEVEAAAAEERRKAQAKATAAKARIMAKAEAAAEPRRRKETEPSWYRSAKPQKASWSGRTLAEATLREFNENGPSLVGR